MESVVGEGVRGRLLDRFLVTGRVAIVSGSGRGIASPASGYLTGAVLEVDGGIDGPNSPSALPDL